MTASNADQPRKFRPATELVHGGTRRSELGEMSEALFLTQGFVYDTAEAAEARFKGEAPGFIYSRFSNPTVAMFEERMARLEGAEAARATASGMAAVLAALMCQLKAGDHVVAHRAMFSSCDYIVTELLPRFGVPSTLVDGTELSNWQAAIRPETKLFFLETPTNPTLEVVDIAAVAEIAHRHGIVVVVDNVFATPLYQKPLALGADVVIYSATKHIDGQGRCLGGIVLGGTKFITETLFQFLRQTGPSMSPFNAWVLLKGLETLEIRVERQARSAAFLADELSRHPAVSRVIYPGRADHPQADIIARQMSGGSTLITFEVADKAAAFRLSNALQIIKISNNLGDAKSILAHPATTTHQRLSDEAKAEFGITPGMLRLSVGLEDPDDLAWDLMQALERA